MKTVIARRGSYLFKVLLDGEIGKFDAGALDGLLYDMARAAGFDEFNGEKL